MTEQQDDKDCNADGYDSQGYPRHVNDNVAVIGGAPAPTPTNIKPPTAKQISTTLAMLPPDAGENGWDAAQVTNLWQGGIPTTVRLYWAQRAQATAGFVDINDQTGTLALTQLHQQALQMLKYWDDYIAKFGNSMNPGRGVTFGTIRRRYRNRHPWPVPGQPSVYSPYNPS